MTFYELLNVSRDSSSEEIELAFSVRLAEFSREAATGSEGAAKKISDLKYARKILTDPKLRAEYDKALTADENLNASPVNLRKSPRVSLTKPESQKRYSLSRRFRRQSQNLCKLKLLSLSRLKRMMKAQAFRQELILLQMQ